MYYLHQNEALFIARYVWRNIPICNSRVQLTVVVVVGVVVVGVVVVVVGIGVVVVGGGVKGTSLQSTGEASHIQYILE